jgi:acyl carrier protein
MTMYESALGIRETLRTHLAEILYCEPAEVGENTVFQDMGLDSVLSVELISIVNASYGLRERAQAVRDHCTLSRLAHYITTKVTVDGDRGAT